MWLLVFRIQFLIPNQTINIYRLKNVDFQNSSIMWSMTPCQTDHEKMSIFWHWNHLRRWLLVFWIQFLIPNQTINLKRLKNVDFHNSYYRWSMTPCQTDHERLSTFWHWNHLRSGSWCFEFSFWYQIRISTS